MTFLSDSISASAICDTKWVGSDVLFAHTFRQCIAGGPIRTLTPDPRSDEDRNLERTVYGSILRSRRHRPSFHSYPLQLPPGGGLEPRVCSQAVGRTACGASVDLDARPPSRFGYPLSFVERRRDGRDLAVR